MMVGTSDHDFSIIKLQRILSCTLLYTILMRVVTYYPNDLIVIVGFEHGPYNISEGIGSINVCVQVKNGVLHSLLHLSLTTMDGTATGICACIFQPVINQTTYY